MVQPDAPLVSKKSKNQAKVIHQIQLDVSRTFPAIPSCNGPLASTANNGSRFWPKMPFDLESIVDWYNLIVKPDQLAMVVWICFNMF